MRPWSFVLWAILCSALCVGCHADSSDDDSSDDDAGDDDVVDDDVDDDADDDGSTDDDLDDDSSDDDTGPAQWCRSIGTLPPDPDWTWTTRVMGRVSEGDFESWLAYVGDTLWVYWWQWDEVAQAGTATLTKLENGTRVDYPLLANPGDPIVGIMGLTVDLDGRPWTVGLDWNHVISPTALSLVRWEEGEIAEVVPVADVGISQFYKLYTLADGRFLLYFAYGVAWAIYQTDAGFVMTYPDFDMETYVPDANGVMHVIAWLNSRNLLHDFGSDTQPFRVEWLGRTPAAFNPDMGTPRTAVDANFALHYIGFLNDYRIWHLYQDGTAMRSEVWSPSLKDRACQQFIGGLDEMDRPFFSFGTCSGDPPVTCFVCKEGESLRSEVIEAAELYGEVSIYDDFALAESGQIAFSAVFGEWDGAETTTRSLKVFVREPSTRQGGPP